MIFGVNNIILDNRMKIKSLFAIFSFFLFFALFSCDDDLNAIGGSIQPPSDTISVTTDTISLNARTISMLDSVYARTISGVLGKYEDDVFGTIKSDYLCQFYFPDDLKFKGDVTEIDSVQFVIDFNYRYSVGDTTAIMGLSVYPVTTPLSSYYYTNADPTKYCDMKELLVNDTYSVSGSKILSATQREIITDLGIPFGQKIYDAWKNGTIKDNKSFNEFFPGVYVTTNFGSESLIKVLYTSIDMYYKYNDVLGNHDGTKDTIRTASLSISATDEVIQLNHIKNKNPENLFEEGTGATYLKTPAGVYTEVVMPIADIAKSMETRNMTTINSAQFRLKGYTELESSDKQGLSRPNTLLLINKDSVDIFFKQRQKPSTYDTSISVKTNFVAGLEESTNSYNFGNISSMITAYKEKNIENAIFYVIPVEIGYDGYGNVIATYNYMRPGSSILRNDAENVKLDLVYSKF